MRRVRSAKYMRDVVTGGTGRTRSRHPVPIAGKTGTAELAKGASHAWFIGFAPYDRRAAGSRSPCWWKMDSTAARRRRRWRPKSSRPQSQLGLAERMSLFREIEKRIDAQLGSFSPPRTPRRREKS